MYIDISSKHRNDKTFNSVPKYDFATQSNQLNVISEILVGFMEFHQMFIWLIVEGIVQKYADCWY